MTEQFYTILTQIGKASIANATSLGTKVEFKYFALGDGNGSYYNPTETQTSLKNEVWRGQIAQITVDEKNPNWIVLETVIPSNVGGFTIREAGVFDTEGNLLAVGKYPETYKPVVADGSVKDLYIRMILEVSNAAVVNLKVDPTVILATKKDIDALDSKITKNENGVSELKQEVNDHKKQKATNTEYGHIRLSDIPTPEGVPKGIITMWSGSIASVPSGWTLCDGTNGAPDLRNRFIVGAGSEYNVGNIGGEKGVKLTEAQMPSHSHSSGSLYTTSAGNHSHGFNLTKSAGYEPFAGGDNPRDSGSTSSAGSHTHGVSGSTSSAGSGQPHENRPPYYALAFIMKL